jgi:hypothetical protein
MGKMDNLLAKGAKKSDEQKKTKKDETPVLPLVPSLENLNAIKAWREAKADEKTAEATRKQQEEILKPQALKAYEEYCRKEGKFIDSAKVQVGTETPVTYVTQQKYSIIPLEDAEKIQAMFGDRFKKCFERNTEIKLSAEALKNEEETDKLLEKLVKACGGEEQFLKTFTIVQTYAPTEYLHQNRFNESELGKLYDQAKEQKLIKPTSPFFR